MDVICPYILLVCAVRILSQAQGIPFHQRISIPVKLLALIAVIVKQIDAISVSAVICCVVSKAYILRVSHYKEFLLLNQEVYIL